MSDTLFIGAALAFFVVALMIGVFTWTPLASVFAGCIMFIVGVLRV